VPRLVGTVQRHFLSRRDRGPKTQLFSKFLFRRKLLVAKSRDLEKSCVLGPLSRRTKNVPSDVPTTESAACLFLSGSGNDSFDSLHTSSPSRVRFRKRIRHALIQLRLSLRMSMAVYSTVTYRLRLICIDLYCGLIDMVD
jgi:hypothetical protein